MELLQKPGLRNTVTNKAQEVGLKMFRLDQKVALITGAAAGIGAGIAAAFARQGADVAISGRTFSKLEQTRNEVSLYGRKVFCVEMDVTDTTQVKKGVSAVEKEFGRIDILINNAGINHPAPGLDVTEENWDLQFNTNVKGGFFLAQCVASIMMRHNWGRIIWISSQSGLVAIPGQPAYCSTKGAVIQLVRTLGVEWAKSGITVNSIAPTFIETALTKKRLENPEYRSYVLGKIPSGKLAKVEDVSAAAVFLASEEAGMVNCHTLCVDGGWTAW